MLTSMMGFILNKNDHRDMRNLTPKETHALHECLTWCRTGLNNKVLQMFSTVFENFHHAAGELMDKIRTVLPEGSTKCRIRTSAREMHQPTTSTLLETLGEESTGMVFLDPVGVPMKYDQMQIYKDIVGTAHCRIHIDALTDERSKHWNWKNTGSIELNLSEKNKTDISRGADHILAQTQIKASDFHYDAKDIFFCVLWSDTCSPGVGKGAAIRTPVSA